MTALLGVRKKATFMTTSSLLGLLGARSPRTGGELAASAEGEEDPADVHGGKREEVEAFVPQGRPEDDRADAHAQRGAQVAQPPRGAHGAEMSKGCSIHDAEA
jgi:hypothetical protein